MRPISPKTRKILENDPRMTKCALKGKIDHICSRKIDWHHNLIYAGRQSDIPNTILGICSNIHALADRREVKKMLDEIMHAQMTEEDYKLLPKLCRK
jgi:hypothetical protein